MGSKISYLLTFADGTSKARAKSLKVTLNGPSNNLNPVEESNLKNWTKWLNIVNDVTAPGFYTRQLDVLDANNQLVCKTNSVSLTISSDMLRRNLPELISKAASRYSIHSAANETTQCRIIHQTDVKETSRMVSNLNDVVNSYNDCRTQCQNEISANSKNFTNAKNPSFPQTLNGCEFSAPLLFSANGGSRAVVLRERIIGVLDVGTLHGMEIYSIPMQTLFAQYGISHWAGVNIFEILGGTNTMATDMYLDWNIRAPQDVEGSAPYSLF